VAKIVVGESRNSREGYLLGAPNGLFPDDPNVSVLPPNEDVEDANPPNPPDDPDANEPNVLLGTDAAPNPESPALEDPNPPVPPKEEGTPKAFGAGAGA